MEFGCFPSNYTSSSLHKVTAMKDLQLLITNCLQMHFQFCLSILNIGQLSFILYLGSKLTSGYKCDHFCKSWQEATIYICMFVWWYDRQVYWSGKVWFIFGTSPSHKRFEGWGQHQRCVSSWKGAMGVWSHFRSSHC